MTTTNPRLEYVPALDGLRAISVTGVMLYHSRFIELPGGFLGVDMFFVISGFLITALLVQEWDKQGTIDLKAFYIRRVLRLLPATLLLLGAMWVATLLLGGYFKTTPQTMGAATLAILFYVTNWTIAFSLLPGFPAALSHTWSLAIEEQFYFLWPILLILLLRRARQAKILLIVGMMIFSVILWRGYLWLEYQSYYRCYFATDTRADALLIGCLAGLLYKWGYMRKIPLMVFYGAGLGLLCAACLIQNEGSYLFLGGLSLVAALSAIVIIGVVNGAGKLILASPLLVLIGRWSYGLYLWHYPAFFLTEKFIQQPAAGVLIEWLLTFLCAGCSYYLIEQPALKLKNRRHPRQQVSFS